MLPVMPMSDDGTSIPLFCCQMVSSKDNDATKAWSVKDKKNQPKRGAGNRKISGNILNEQQTHTLMAADISSADTEPNSRPSSPDVVNVTMCVSAVQQGKVSWGRLG